MPYIVTITSPRTRSAIHPDSGMTASGDGRPSPFTFPTRTAYADMDEARATIFVELGDRGAITGPEDPLIGEVLDLPEHGGFITFGEGVSIEVAHATYADLGNALQMAGDLAPSWRWSMADTEVIDTYNDAQRRTTA